MASRAPWIICPTCDGDGSHSRHLGAFTQSEFDDQFDNEEQERYFAGEYDRPCECCNGSGKIRADDTAGRERSRTARMWEKGVNDAGERLW